MTTTTASLIAAATTAALAIKSTKEQGKEAAEAAFRASAEATATALDNRVSAAALAAANKAAGAGYGSDAAVGFHAVTGLFLRLDGIESFEGSATSIQAKVKKIGQPKAKAILKKAASIDDAVERLDAAVADIEFDVDKAVAALLKAVQKIEVARVSGVSFADIDKALAILDDVETALVNVRDPKVVKAAA